MFSIYLNPRTKQSSSSKLQWFENSTNPSILARIAFFRRNLPYEERIKSLVSQSNIRRNYLAKTTSSIMKTEIREQDFLYTVKVGIGTFKSKPPYKEYYLEMDTGSSLVWMQCEGCTKCFKQTPKPFPKQNSTSFRPILVNNKPRYYEYGYGDGSTTIGMSARETFYLTSKNGGLAKIENLEFGCGLDNVIQYGKYKNNKIAGLMGLGWDDTSFVKQLGPIIKGVFSYCLPLVSDKTPTTYLRFGDDKSHKEKNSKITPLYRRNQDSPYFVNLQGINVNETRLKIDPKMLDFKNNSTSGGCIIDTGTPYSRIVGPAFNVLKLELEKYFSRLKGFKKIKTDFGLDLCYERSSTTEKYSNLPSVTLHLRGSHADFVMKAEAVFEVTGKYFYLAMVRDGKESIIGSHQQINHRLIHDIKNKRLVFYPVDSSKNP